MCQNDPKKLLQNIRRLGPRKKTDIPMKVDIEGNITSDKEEVKKVWRTEFYNLLNPNQEGQNFDSEFLSHKTEVINNMETDMRGDHFVQNCDINEEISALEVKNVVEKLKNRKAGGVDAIANEV